MRKIIKCLIKRIGGVICIATYIATDGTAHGIVGPVFLFNLVSRMIMYNLWKLIGEQGVE